MAAAHTPEAEACEAARQADKKASAELEKKQRDKQQGIIELQQKMMQLANPSGEGA